MKKFAIILMFASLAMSAVASDKEVEDFLAKMRKAYKGLNSATFKLETTLQGPNGDIVAKMSGGFKSPNKMFAEIKSDDGNIKIITDGKRIFAVNDEIDQVADIPYSTEIMQRALSWANLEVLNFFDWEQQLSTDDKRNMHDSKLSIRQNEEWNGKKWTVLEELAPSVGVYVEYYIDPKTHLIWRTVRMTVDKEFITGDFILKALKPGAKIDDKKFKKPIIT